MPQQTFGYEMDDNNNVIKITNLYAATKFFENKFRDFHFGNHRVTNFKIIDKIEGDYIVDYTKPSTETENNPTQNAPRQDMKKFTICWVVEVEYLSVFNTPDKKYYYVIFRGKWFNRWANTYYERAKKYYNKDGITIKIDIPRHALPKIDLSTLVLVTGGTEIYYIKMKDIVDLANKNLGIFTDKWNQVCVGIPKEKFSLGEDVNNYD